MFDYQAPSALLRDRVVLVTGASSGLGRAAALAYAGHGATVILHGRDIPRLEQVYDEIEAGGHPQPAITPLDLELAGEEDYQALVQGIDEEFGRLDGLLCNAGMMGPQMPLQMFSLAQWNRVLQTNLTATFMLCKYCLPLLAEGNNPSIILTSSTAGRQAFAYTAPYTVAKHGVEALMEVLFLELENTSPIRVNSVNPGPCATPLRRVSFPAEDPTTLPAPDDLMGVYLYLMGDDSVNENGKRFSAQ